MAANAAMVMGGGVFGVQGVFMGVSPDLPERREEAPPFLTAGSEG